MMTINSGDQYELESAGRIEVQGIEVKTPSVDVDDAGSITNPVKVVDDSEVYIRIYSYVSGMPGSIELEEFIEKAEPYQEDD